MPTFKELQTRQDASPFEIRVQLFWQSAVNVENDDDVPLQPMRPIVDMLATGAEGYNMLKGWLIERFVNTSLNTTLADRNNAMVQITQTLKANDITRVAYWHDCTDNVEGSMRDFHGIVTWRITKHVEG